MSLNLQYYRPFRRRYGCLAQAVRGCNDPQSGLISGERHLSEGYTVRPLQNAGEMLTFVRGSGLISLQ